MSSDSVSCRLFKIHDYKKILETEKYIIESCSVCYIYKVTYKAYNIKCKFKQNELPPNILSQFRKRR